MKPHPLVITLLTQVEDVIPRWKIVPTKQDVIDAAFKDPVKREKVSQSVIDDCLAFQGKKWYCQAQRNALTMLLPCHTMTWHADQEEPADLPGQAAAQDCAGDAQGQHVHRRQLVTGT